jgi:hypothetical protein
MPEIHQDWWMLFAGDDITSVFDIVDYTRSNLPAEEPVTIEQVDVEQASRGPSSA